MSSVATKSLVIGTRGSKLALWQAQYIASLLEQAGVPNRIEIIKTTGDQLQTAPFAQAGIGLFTKEIEEALLSGAIDLAVHSLKDLPTQTPEGLAIAAVPEREDPRDALVGSQLQDLRSGARVGTSSGRRAAQLRRLRPDLDIQPIRGNVDTRLRKLHQGDYTAILLAVAGLRRLGLEQEIAEALTPEQICPAPGQGALAIETRQDDPAFAICRDAGLNHEPTRAAVACERAALAGLGGGCQLPIGAYCNYLGAKLHLLVVVVSPDGRRELRTEAEGSPDDPEYLGRQAASELLARGAADILTEVP